MSEHDSGRRRGLWSKLGVGLSAIALAGGVMTTALEPASAGMVHHVERTGGVGLSVRSSPDLGAPVIATLGEGQAVEIACQTEGADVNGSTIWNQVGGGYSSDYYFDTPVYDGFSPGLAICASATAPTEATPVTSTYIVPDACGLADVTFDQNNDFVRVAPRSETQAAVSDWGYGCLTDVVIAESWNPGGLEPFRGYISNEIRNHAYAYTLGYDHEATVSAEIVIYWYPAGRHWWEWRHDYRAILAPTSVIADAFG